MRSKFEGLPEIAEKLHTVFYNEDFNQYHAAMVNSSTSVKYIQGAWYAFQEREKNYAIMNEYTKAQGESIKMLNDERIKQDKRIEEMKSKVQDIWTELDDRQSKEYIIEKCEEIIKELLK